MQQKNLAIKKHNYLIEIKKGKHTALDLLLSNVFSMINDFSTKNVFDLFLNAKNLLPPSIYVFNYIITNA